MEPEGSLPFSQKPATEPYPDPSIPISLMLFLLCWVQIFPQKSVFRRPQPPFLFFGEGQDVTSIIQEVKLVFCYISFVMGDGSKCIT
jgi:hypothetical protein